jgi:hypothetical protein
MSPMPRHVSNQQQTQLGRGWRQQREAERGGEGGAAPLGVRAGHG